MQIERLPGGRYSAACDRCPWRIIHRDLDRLQQLAEIHASTHS